MSKIQKVMTSLFFCLVFCGSGTVYADTQQNQKHMIQYQGRQDNKLKNENAGEVIKPQTLDDLFRRLQKSEDEDEAAGLSRLIERRMEKSGSPTADLLMRRAGQAAQNDPALAIEITDRILVLEPQWSQAWFMRSQLFLLLSDSLSAFEDMKQTVHLEPRHYQAWVYMGMLFADSEDEKTALALFRKALSINPFYPGLGGMIQKLSRKFEGFRI